MAIGEDRGRGLTRDGGTSDGGTAVGYGLLSSFVAPWTYCEFELRVVHVHDQFYVISYWLSSLHAKYSLCASLSCIN